MDIDQMQNTPLLKSDKQPWTATLSGQFLTAMKKFHKYFYNRSLDVYM